MVFHFRSPHSHLFLLFFSYQAASLVAVTAAVAAGATGEVVVMAGP